MRIEDDYKDNGSITRDIKNKRKGDKLKVQESRFNRKLSQKSSPTRIDNGRLFKSKKKSAAVIRDIGELKVREWSTDESQETQKSNKRSDELLPMVKQIKNI